MIYVVMAVLGLALGSFVNALVWRVHEQEELRAKSLDLRSKKAAKLQDLSITRGRSMCPACRHQLAAKDLIPVLSWISLRGRCRYCHKPIEDTPVVELGTCLAFIMSYAVWPYSWSVQGVSLFILWLPILVVLIALMVYDLRWMLLPNRLMVWLLGLVGLQVVLQCLLFGGSLDNLISAAWGFVVLGGLFYAIFQLSGGRWIGGGDVKLGFGLGMLVGGPLPALLVLFLASLLGTLVSLPLMATKRLQATSRIPFGPFLIIAGVAVYLFGAAWIAWLQARLVMPA